MNGIGLLLLNEYDSITTHVGRPEETGRSSRLFYWPLFFGLLEIDFDVVFLFLKPWIGLS